MNKTYIALSALVATKLVLPLGPEARKHGGSLSMQAGVLVVVDDHTPEESFPTTEALATPAPPASGTAHYWEPQIYRTQVGPLPWGDV
jgi:hypothetical protein